MQETWDTGSVPGSRRCLWSRKWQPTPVFLLGKPHGQRSLVCSPWDHKNLDLTERLCTHMCHKGQHSNSGSLYMCSLLWLFTSFQMKVEMKSISIYFKEILLSLSNMFWGHLTWKRLFWMGSESVQWLSDVWFFATPWIAPHQASLSITNSRMLRKLMSTGSLMPSSHLILCHPLLLPLSIFPSIRVFYNKLVLRIRWSNY